MAIQNFYPLFLGLVFSLALTPLVRWLSFRLGKVYYPRADRWHRNPTPTLGGVGFFIAFWLGLLASAALQGNWVSLQWGVLAGSALAFAIGLLDDFHPMSPVAKLTGQILAATITILLGYTSTFFTPRLADSLLAQLPNILFTYAWLVGISNAINLLDNMDGLAGGISLITAAFLSYFFWRAGNLGLMSVALALAGSLVGFLAYNFPPAKIFMGDSGSLFLGFTLATLAIAQQQQASDVLAVLGVPTLLFLLPILDTALVTFTRLLRGQSPAQGGRDHTSHRLIAFGLSERQTLLVLYGVAVASGVLAAVVESLNYWLSLALAPFLLILLALLAAYLGGLKVVAPTTPSPRQQAIARMMLGLTFRFHLLEAILDFFLIALAYYLAFLGRYGRLMDASRLELYLGTLPVALACAYLAFISTGVYQGVWRYVDFEDLARYFQAALGSAALLAGAVFLLNASNRVPWSEDYPAMLFAWFAVFLLIGLAASRSTFRFMDRLSSQRLRPDEEPVLILGAGDAGEMALRWILMNPHLHYRPLGFLDDDPLLARRKIHGVPVLGGLDRLAPLLARGEVKGLILAVSTEHPGEDDDLLHLCQAHGCWLRVLRLGFEEVAASK